MNCRDCVLGMTYRPRLRERNLILQDEYAPKDRIKLVILGESPPIGGGYIYDRHTKCTSRSFSYQVFSDLNCVGFKGPVSDDDKEIALQKMQHVNKAIVLDCCNCAANLKGRISDSQRESLVAACFSRFAEQSLDSICKEYGPEIWFKLPSGRGSTLWDDLKIKYGPKIIRKEYWSPFRRLPTCVDNLVFSG